MIEKSLKEQKKKTIFILFLCMSLLENKEQELAILFFLYKNVMLGLYV